MEHASGCRATKQCINSRDRRRRSSLHRHHSSRQAFCQDRQRDYELMTSGYLVLRLPHSEVVGALEAAIAKIQQFVRFRRQQMPASATSMS